MNVYPSAESAAGEFPTGIAFIDDIVVDELASSEVIVPALVFKMFRETLLAAEHSINTLAGMGVRATIEAVCKDKEVDGDNLEQRIDGLAGGNLITKNQAELLHCQRSFGNFAVHEFDTPSDSELRQGIKVVEGLISEAYVLPVTLGRMKTAVEEKKKRSGKQGKSKSS
jgi:hypothetical protein